MAPARFVRPKRFKRLKRCRPAPDEKAVAQEPGTKPASEFVGFREDLMRVNRLQAIVVLLMLALACLRAHAQPATPVDPPLPDQELVIGTREVPPFVMKRKDGSWRRISIALWHRIAERLHVRYRFAEQKTNRGNPRWGRQGHVRCRDRRDHHHGAARAGRGFHPALLHRGVGRAVPTGEPRWRAIFRTLFSLGFLQAVAMLLRPRNVHHKSGILGCWKGARPNISAAVREAWAPASGGQRPR